MNDTQDMMEQCQDIEKTFAQPGYGEIYGVATVIIVFFVCTLIHYFH